MRKYFEFYGRKIRESADLLEREFPSQCDAANTQLNRKLYAGFVGTGHLSGRVQSECWYDAFGEPSHTEVLDNYCIHTSFSGSHEDFLNLRKFIIEHKCVESEIPTATLVVDLVHDCVEGLQFEIGSSCSCVESRVDPEIHGVRACAEGCIEAGLVTRWSKYLDAPFHAD